MLFKLSEMHQMIKLFMIAICSNLLFCDVGYLQLVFLFFSLIKLQSQLLIACFNTAMVMCLASVDGACKDCI